MASDPTAVAAKWLATFEAQEDISLVFGADCWLRDLLVLSHDFTTRHGVAEIRSYLIEARRDRRLCNFRLDARTRNGGATFVAEPPGVTALFRFDVAGALDATARGCVRLVQESEGSWKAWTVLLVLQDFVGFEENIGRASVHVARAGQTWDEALEESAAAIEDDLEVLIVGAGHSGLMVAARLKQMGVKTLVIDRAQQVGDSWRNRYPTLKLHTPTFMNSFPYQPYPSTWPTYLPKAKMSSFLCGYKEAQDLLVWESTELLSDPCPVFDEATNRWTVYISREGKGRTLYPRHVVLAIGTNTLPKRIEVPGLAEFQGVVYHSAGHRDAARSTGRRIVVIGACNSGADIALDMLHNGAAEITIVQRSPTAYISMSAVESVVFSQLWPEDAGATIDELDLINNSIPHSLLLRILRSTPGTSVIDRPALDALNEAGFKTSDTPLYELLLTRGGGYLMDQGGIAQHIKDGRIKVKSGVEVERMDKQHVVLTDGTLLPADVVVFAIGYEGMRATASTIFGPSIDNTSDVWGLDGQGELKGVYRPSGKPALWYAAGDYTHARFLGRLLALQILASERGLLARGV